MDVSILVAIIIGIITFAFGLRRFLRGPLNGSKIRKRLDGKVVVITGANTGIGKETAKDLIARGARIIILCRDVKKGNDAAEDIKNTTGKSNVEVRKLDLASLESVRECAKQLNEKEEKIDILINNAGIMMCPYWKTKDNFEMQIGTNHLGHFLLTELLLPLVKNSVKTGFHPRIINISSIAHNFGNMNFDDFNSEKSYDPMVAYGQSKLANILHAKELAVRLKDSGISVYSLHPGNVDTNLNNHFYKWWSGMIIAPFYQFFIKTPLHGAQTTLYCALEDSIEKDSGKYYADCAEKTPNSKALRVDDQRKLWDISEKLVGLK